MFDPVSNKVDFNKIETEVLAFWEKNDIFKKSLRQTEGKPDFVFFDGPPFATGLPHYGHLLASAIKDIIPRYQTMRGRHVERRFGWDTHGLPIEALAQDALGVSGVQAIQELGVDRFNEQCRSMVLRYVSEWRTIVTRIGRWVDFDHDYKTMNFEFMESVWWAFKQLWDQGRIYKSHRIMPYSWKLNTPLSNFEAGSNYKDVQDPTVTVRTPVRTGADPAWGPVTYLLVWTTTPWTLPENLAICAGPDIDYVVVRDLSDPARPCYVMAEALLPTIFRKEADREVVTRLKGTQLKGWTYEPIFPYFADQAANGAFVVLNDGYVTTEDGVGLVHIAPAYGEDDFRVCKANGLKAFVDPLDSSCNFTSQLPEYAGRFCKDCDKDIIKALKAAGTGNDKVARHIAADVVAELVEKGYNGAEQIPDIELVQDLVEHSFIKRGLSKAAKLFILYRQQTDEIAAAVLALELFSPDVLYRKAQLFPVNDSIHFQQISQLHIGIQIFHPNFLLISYQSHSRLTIRKNPRECLFCTHMPTFQDLLYICCC